MPNKATTTAFPREDLDGALMEAPSTFKGVALDIFPPMPVPNVAGNFPSLPVEAFRSRGKTKRATKSGYNRTDWKFGSGTYACDEHGHEEVRDDHEARIYEKLFDYEFILATRANNVIQLEQEIRVRDLCHDTATFTGSTNFLDSTVDWDQSATADLVGDCQIATEKVKGKCGQKPDGLQIPWQAWPNMWKSDQILQRIKYTVGGMAPDINDLAARTAMAQALGFKKLVIAEEAFYNSADEGQTATIADVWSNLYAFAFVMAKTKDIQEPCIGRTFHYDGDGGLYTTEMYRDEKVRGDVYRGRQCVQNKRILTSCGFLIQIDT